MMLTIATWLLRRGVILWKVPESSRGSDFSHISGVDAEAVGKDPEENPDADKHDDCQEFHERLLLQDRSSRPGRRVLNRLAVTLMEARIRWHPQRPDELG
jgi:hypothetical protein